MALLEEQFTEKLDAGAPDITYEGNEGQEQQIAQALWDKLPPQVRMQFGDFSQFFNTGAWKKVLQMIQQRQGPEEIQETETVESAPQGGLGAMAPAPRTMAHGGRPGYGLGSFIKKAVRGVTKPFKKIAKSPIGKAALMYAGTAGLGNLMAGAPQGWGLGAGKGLGWLGPKAAMSNLGAGFLGTSPVGDFDPGRAGLLKKLGIGAGFGNPLSTKAKWGLGTAAAAALPFGMQAMGQWDKGPEEFTRMGGKFDFDYDQMRQDIAEAVAEGDYENFKAVLAKYGATEGVQVGFWDTLAHGAEGGRVAAQEGGLMDLGGMEKDYRDDGGFVPIGGEEKADDVPARLSKNEFVFTADAVRAAGGGDIDQGAEIMENVMKNLEGGGKISEESQGQGARDMFQVSERLSEVV
jgi:hypothetical protein